MRVLILGCTGQLGKDLTTVFEKEGEVAGYNLPELDISEKDAIQREALEHYVQRRK